MDTKRVLVRFLLFALIGLLMEVFFTGLGSLIHNADWNIRGHTSPWMMVDYGLLAILIMPMARVLSGWRIPLAGRAVVYMLGIYIIEFVSGWVFDICGLEIWDYSHLPLNVCGYITFAYAPCWYLLGLVAEWAYRRVDAMALVLAYGVEAERIEPLCHTKT